MTRAAHGHRHKLKGLYAITDQHLISASNFQQAVEQALQGGASIIQYRDKSDDKKKVKKDKEGALHEEHELHEKTIEVEVEVEKETKKKKKSKKQ